MRFLAWSAAMGVGVPSIDEEHRRLIDLFNLAMAEVFAGVEPAETRDRVLEMFDLARHMFVREEEHLASTNDPHLDNHRKAHAVLRREMDRLAERLTREASHSLAMDALSRLQGLESGHLTGGRLATVH